MLLFPADTWACLFFGGILQDLYLYPAWKHLAVIILLISILGQSFSKYIVILNYQLNRDYIAKYLCEYRNKPTMACGGKCYLNKNLKKEEKKDQDNPERKAENKFELIASHAVFMLPDPHRLLTNFEYSPYQLKESNRFKVPFSHPPDC